MSARSWATCATLAALLSLLSATCVLAQDQRPATSSATAPAPATPAAPAPAQPAPATPEPPATPPASPWWAPFSFEAWNEASRRFWEQTRDATTDALDTTKRLATGTVVRETHACAQPGGGQDCEATAKAVCAAKGYATGRPLDTTSKQTCPAVVTLGVRRAEPGECKLEYTIASSVCW